METENIHWDKLEGHEIFDRIDELAREAALQKHTNIPRAFIAGNDDVEQAEFVKAIIGFRIEDAAGANVPTSVVLRHGEQDEVDVFSEPMVDGITRDKDASPAESSQQDSLLSTTDHMASWEMGVDRTQIFSETLLGFKLRSRDLPDLSFVYLPNLGSLDGSGRSPWPWLLGDAQHTVRCVFVLVLRISSGDIATIPAVQQARQYDPYGCRTLLIITGPTKESGDDELGVARLEQETNLISGSEGFINADRERAFLQGRTWKPQLYVAGPWTDQRTIVSMRTDVTSWMTRLLRIELDAFAVHVDQKAVHCQQLLDQIDSGARAALGHVAKELSDWHQLQWRVAQRRDGLIKTLHDDLERELEREQDQDSLESPRSGPDRRNFELVPGTSALTEEVIAPSPNRPGDVAEFPIRYHARVLNAVDEFLDHVWKLVRTKVDDTLNNGFKELRDRVIEPAMREIESDFRWLARQIVSSFQVRVRASPSYSLRLTQQEQQWKDGRFRKLMRQSLLEERRRTTPAGVDVERWFTREVPYPVLEMDAVSRRRIHCREKLDILFDELCDLVVTYGIFAKMPAILTPAAVRAWSDDFIAVLWTGGGSDQALRTTTAATLDTMLKAQRTLRKAAIVPEACARTQGGSAGSPDDGDQDARTTSLAPQPILETSPACAPRYDSQETSSPRRTSTEVVTGRTADKDGEQSAQAPTPLPRDNDNHASLEGDILSRKRCYDDISV